MSRRGWMLFAALGVIWGIPYLLIRISVRDIAPPTLVFFRTAPAGLLLLPLALRGRSLLALRAHWRAIIAYSIVELAVPWLFLSRGEQRLSSSIAGLLIATVPIISVVISSVTKHEDALGWRRFVGLLIGSAGVVIIVGIDIHGSQLIAVGEVGVAAVGYSLGPYIVSRYLSDVPAIGVVTASLLLTAVGYSPIALTHLPSRLSPEELVSVLILIMICTALAFVIFFSLISEVGPARATVVTYINPAVAVVLGIGILHEHFSTGLALGFPLVLLGSFFGTGGLRRGVVDRPRDDVTSVLSTGRDSAN